jgi:O-methyltransferase
LLRRHGDRVFPGPIARAHPRLEAIVRMARWWRPWSSRVAYHRSREELYAHGLSRIGTPRMYLEFGVAKGASLRWWVGHVTDASTTFVGFDTFEGIPEAWGRQPAGSYTAHGDIPDIDDDRVRFEVGRFEETIPGFLDAQELSHPLVLHLDADLYASTETVLRTIGPLLSTGDLVIFDELLDVGTAEHEFLALDDLAPTLGLNWTPIAAVDNGPQVALAVTEPAGASP